MLRLHLYKQIGWARPVWVAEARPCSIACMQALELWAERCSWWEIVRGQPRRVLLKWVLPLVLLWLVCGPAQVWSVSYTLLETSPFYPTAINNHGHMAGQWCDGVTGCYPALWRAEDDIALLSDQLGIAWSLNDTDEAVFEDAAGAWFKAPGEEKIPLSKGETGYDIAVPLKLNNQRQIVGSLRNIHASGACPARWESPTAAPECATPFASAANSQGLNKHGASTGWWQSGLQGEDVAFVDDGIELQPIPFGVTVALTDRGAVLYEGSQVWKPDGTLSDQVPVENCQNTFGVDMNNAGWILGECSGQHRAWVRDAQGRVIDLTQAVNDPALSLEFPWDISEKGEIVVWGFRDGVLRGVRLTPRVVALVRSRR